MADEATVTIEPGAVSDAGVTESAPSAEDAVRNAMEKVANKTQQAADKLAGGETDAPNRSKGPTNDAGEADAEAAKRSESAKKGAETKRKNAEAAKEAEAAESAKASDDRVKEAEARAAKAEKAAEKAAAKSEETMQATETAETPAKREAPQEWSKEAKADWEKTPDTVRDQVDRMQGEFQKGLEKYKTGAEKWDSVARFEPLAQQFQADLPTVLDDYSKMSEMMRRNPIQGINYLAQRHGISMTELAEQVLGQQSNESYKALETNLTKALNHIKTLEAKVGQVQQQELNKNRSYIDEVRLKNPDFDRLEPDVMFMLKNHKGLGDTPNERLDNALIRARNMAGLPQPSKNSSVSAETVTEEKAKSAETAEATTSAGSQSGTVPKSQGPAGSAEEAVKRAFSKIKGR